MSSDNIYANITGAILAGGRNKRMAGRDKAFIDIRGVPIIQRTLDIFKDVFEEIIIVTNSPDGYMVYEKDCRIVTDLIKGAGPLGGIWTALSYARSDAVFFTACDMPFLHKELIHKLVYCFNETGCSALVPKAGPDTEPLHSIFRTSLKEDIAGYIKNSADRSIKGFLDTVDVRYLELDDVAFARDVFTNLNTPADVEKCKNIIVGQV